VAGCCECGDEPSGSCATELGSSGLNTWYLTFRVEHTLGMFGNKVLRRIFGWMREK
jgi:hypothetical protein